MIARTIFTASCGEGEISPPRFFGMFKPANWMFRKKQKERAPDNVLNLRPPVQKTVMDLAADWFAWTILVLIVVIYHGFFIFTGMVIGPVWK